MTMDLSNAIVTAGAGGMLFILGLITSYVRTIKHDMKELLEMAIAHKTKIEMAEQQIKDIYDKLYKLNRA